ncbi:MAG: cadmium-translocating P-type ATPase [Duncaniella sp.]|nr:cadmium-translocating P-type ATPase [Duncaniella sp.]
MEHHHTHTHPHPDHGCGNDGGCCHSHHSAGASAWTAPVISAVMLVAGMLMTHFSVELFANRLIELAWYILAFLPVGLPVMKEAAEGIGKGDIFNENTLMVIACIGAFCIWELPEAVGVMLFSSIGESLQHGAVDRARADISRLIDGGVKKVTVIHDGKTLHVEPENVKIGETVEVGPGARVPLDGVLAGSDGIFDTSALTGESVPRTIECGGEVLAGMIALRKSVNVKVTRLYSDSAMQRILAMVENASSRKAQAEMFIRKFARIYTPVVLVLAALLVAVPALIGALSTYHFVFSVWLYRALVFLVISCPCALVISVPLGYYAGIGAASRAGILFKGGNYLEAITKVNVIAMDKTGTLTTGRFSVVSVESPAMESDEMLALMAAAEHGSSHPLAATLTDYAASLGITIPSTENMAEKAGHGVSARINGKEVMAGNARMLSDAGIVIPSDAGKSAMGTIIYCAVDRQYAGCAILADTAKPDAAEAVEKFRNLGIDNIVMLSGDRKEIVEDFASRLGITEARGELLPQDKAGYVEKLASTDGNIVAFVGDGMNDAPVLALSNVGIAMGGLGSDAAIESADVVIQTDAPSRIATAIKIGRTTRAIVTQNIVGAIAIKVLILILGAMGYASLWGAVFADVGVALLAVLNSMRIMWRRY